MSDSTFTTAMNACKRDRQNTIQLLKRADKEEKQEAVQGTNDPVTNHEEATKAIQATITKKIEKSRDPGASRDMSP